MTAQPKRPSLVALVPARAGSTRLPGKNMLSLGGHPLLAYAIAAAAESAVFDAIVASTDDEDYAGVARHYGAEVPILRPAELSTADAPDIGWVRHMLEYLCDQERRYDGFSILRPTSPFRTGATVRRALEQFLAAPDTDSVRAVEPASQHPGKMWRIIGNRLVPVLPVQPEGIQWHSRATQSLPAVWVQNASLELAWSRCVWEQNSISGEAIVPFFTQGAEGLDINTHHDWLYAEQLATRDPSSLPHPTVPAWSGTGDHEVTDG